MENLGLKNDYPPGTIKISPDSQFAILMALFMMCTIEVVLIKIFTLEEERERGRPTAASLFFNQWDNN